jgi:hypothetical protein
MTLSADEIISNLKILEAILEFIVFILEIGSLQVKSELINAGSKKKKKHKINLKFLIISFFSFYFSSQIKNEIFNPFKIKEKKE